MPSIPVDILVFIVIFAVSFFGILYFGKSAGVSAILGFYPSLLIYENFPYLEKISGYGRNEVEVGLLKLAVFLILLLVVYIVMRRAVSVVFSWSPVVKIIEAFILAIVLTGFLILSYVYITETSDLIETLVLSYLFNTNPTTFFWWLTGTIPVLFFSLRR